MWFFQGWSDVWQTAASGVVLFAALLAGIRLVGNRTLASMNASDFIVTVVTVALGTTVASTMLSPSISLVAGLTGMATLVALQAISVWLSVRHPRLRQRAEGEPVILLRDGVPVDEHLLAAHVSRAELRQAVRQQGYGDYGQLALVVLEPNGRFSVIPRQRRGSGVVLHDPRRHH
jgi:uncharacterized membrane protein YcaP (DUF421 family)